MRPISCWAATRRPPPKRDSRQGKGEAPPNAPKGPAGAGRGPPQKSKGGWGGQRNPAWHGSKQGEKRGVPGGSPPPRRGRIEEGASLAPGAERAGGGWRGGFSLFFTPGGLGGGEPSSIAGGATPRRASPTRRPRHGRAWGRPRAREGEEGGVLTRGRW